MNESFTTNTGAVTHDSNPRLLRMVGISQDPSVMFQQGETVLEDYGTAVNLSNAHGLGEIDTPIVPAPVMSELLGGAGNMLQVTLMPPADTGRIAANNLITGKFAMRVNNADYCDDMPIARLKYDGGTETSWVAPVGFANSYAKAFNDIANGNWSIEFIFTDETSASIALTAANVMALANAQSLGTARYGTINLTSLLFPYANASGGKAIADIRLYKTTLFGALDAYTFTAKIEITDSNGNYRNILNGTDAAGFVNLTYDSDSVVTPATTFTLANTPAVRMRLWSMGNAAVMKPADEYVSVQYYRLTEFTSSPAIIGLQIQFFDNLNNPLSAAFDGNLPLADWQTHTFSLSFTGPDRYVYYKATLTQPSLSPVTVDIPFTASALITAATASGEEAHQAGLITNIAGTLLNGYSGYVLTGWNFVAAAGYTSSVTPINSSSALPHIVFVDSVHGSSRIGQLTNLPTPVAELDTIPFAVALSSSVTITVSFSLMPNTVLDVYYPLLVSEAYEIRNRNQIALRFVCKPPFTGRPGDYTTPEFTVRVYGSQGETPKRTILGDNGRYTLWTPIPFNVQGTSGISKDNLSKSIGCYVFEDYLPDNWSGSAVTFDREYLAPWNYIRVVITPTAEGETTPDLTGYIMSIIANAREL